MKFKRSSHCKINLLLNILGNRSDGFHELETILHPLPFADLLSFEESPLQGVRLTCNDSRLPVDSGNLVYRAASLFFAASGILSGVDIHLEKRVPLGAGLGGGSSNAAITLLTLNEIFGLPIPPIEMGQLAASLGSDVPFFLQNKPALGTHRGEHITPLEPFACLKGRGLFLIHPGFGISTAWAYQDLSRFPDALNGQKGRATAMIDALRSGTLSEAAHCFYNSLEAPVLSKYPLLVLFQEFLRSHEASVTMMSGSGSTTFAIFEEASRLPHVESAFKTKFGEFAWITSVIL